VLQRGIRRWNCPRCDSVCMGWSVSMPRLKAEVAGDGIKRTLPASPLSNPGGSALKRGNDRRSACPVSGEIHCLAGSDLRWGSRGDGVLDRYRA